ncbi:MAG: 3-oxoacyl-ACP reductase family protein [Candidatus Omnitrophota bacterium]
MKELKDKVAIVTGGSRGIGRAVVLMLAKEGCHVAFSYHRSKEEALKVEQDARKLGVKCEASQVDVKDFNQVKKWVEETKEKFGRLDILINNAGIIIDKALMLMSPKDWQEVLGTNLTGVFNASRSCIVTFLKQKSGDIINMSSVSGLIGLPRQINYAATKGGINALTKSLAKEVAGYGVRVNAVAPGFIETDILSGMTPEQRTKISESVPLGRIGTVEDVSNCVKFLLSQEARYLTGQIIQVDGGLAIGGR